MPSCLQTSGTVELPRVGKSGVVNQFRIGQAAQECNQVFPILGRERYSGYALVLVRVVEPSSGVGTAGDGAPPGGVMVQNLFQRGNAAIVHVRRGQRYVAQRRSLELANIGWLPGVF